MSNAKDQLLIKQANRISGKNAEIAGLRESLHHAKARIAELEAALSRNELMADGKLYDGQDLDKLLNRISVLEDAEDPPPDGYPSWEDWLADHGVTIHRGAGYWRLRITRLASEEIFPTYPTALEAAKKEVGR